MCCLQQLAGAALPQLVPPALDGEKAGAFSASPETKGTWWLTWWLGEKVYSNHTVATTGTLAPAVRTALPQHSSKQPETTAPQAAGVAGVQAGAAGRVQEHSLAAARAALKGRHARERKCSRTFLSWSSHGPAEGSQQSLLPQIPNRIIQAPAAVVQARGRHSTALEAREEGALAIAHPEAIDGGRHRKPAQAGAGPGCATAARDGTWENAASRAERHWR